MTKTSREPLPWEADEKTIATKYVNEHCGLLHFEWVIDRYFGLVTQNVILPTAKLIYDSLVEKNYTENNRLEYHDDTVFWIPSKNKVFVQTTQSRDFLFIISNNEFSEDGFHVRRIYRDIQTDDYLVKELKKPSLKTIRRYAEDITEYHDDDCEYPRRPSLETYRKIDFQIPYMPKDHMKEKAYYGDFRDGGYILSYDGFLAKNVKQRIEGSKYSFKWIESIATIYLPCVARELELNAPQLPGYER